MRKTFKKVVSVVIIVLLCVPNLNSKVAYAYDSEEAESTEYVLSEEQTAPEGYSLFGENSEGGTALEEDIPQMYNNENGEISDQIDNDLYLAGPSETSGNLTDTISYTYKDGVLTISGSGDMPDFGYREAPWFQDGTYLDLSIVNIGENITSVGSYSFTECYYIIKVNLPQSLKRINSSAFALCKAIHDIELPEGLEELGYGAFVDCASVKDGRVYLPNIKSIGQYMFQSINIDEIIIGDKLSNMPSNVFSFANVKKFTVDEANPNYKTVDGVMYSKDGTRIFAYPTQKEDTSFTVGADVKVIGTEAFCNNQYLREINLGSITEIEDSGFCYMKNLEKVALPDSLKEVGDFTFYDSPRIESVKFGNGLKSTSYQMFRECSSLTSVDFGGLTELDAHTFAQTNLKEIDIPISITVIGAGCFGNCYQLKKVTTHNLKVVPFQAFLNCSNLEELNLNEGVISISRASCLGAWKLKTVTVPQSVTYVHSRAFEKDVQLNCLNPNVVRYGMNGRVIAEDVNINVTQRYDYAFAVLDLVNQYRQQNGLQPLYMDEDLLEAAMLRSAETVVMYSHTRPDSGTCFSACYDKMVAENIAYNQANPESVMSDWMNSSGHRENILGASYKSIGIGCVEFGGQLYWVQCFGKNQNASNCAMKANDLVSRNINLAMMEFGEADDSTGVNFSFGEPKVYQFKSRIMTRTELAKGQTTYLQYYVFNPGSELWVPVDVMTTTSSLDSNVVAIAGNKVTANNYGMTKLRARSKKGMLFNADFKVSVVSNVSQNTDVAVSGYQPPAFQAGYYDIRVNGGEWNGTYYRLNGQVITNSFFCDGTYTYFLQADGTPMKDRLTYHPDGLHIIYFDQNGHEVFSDFSHISKSIAGVDVDDYCFFDSLGYMYVDTLTYDKTGTKLYYINEYGVLERGRWFQFSGKEFDKGLGFSGRSGGYGYANADFSLMTNTYTYDWNGNYVYIQGDGHMFR